MTKANTTVAFRISPNDFQEMKEYLWFTDFHESRLNKSLYYKKAVLPKIKATRRGKEEEFDKLIQYVEVMGIDKVLEAVEDSTTSKPINEDQITSIVQSVLQSVGRSSGITISDEQQREIIKEVREPSKHELDKLFKLTQPLNN